MELFKYGNSDEFLDGQVINGWDSASWTERFRQPGEFEIIAPLSSGLRDFLPLGTYISHTRTLDVMMVENHQISEDVDADPTLTITGRDLKCLLEERVIGQNHDWAGNYPPTLGDLEFITPADHDWVQVVYIIDRHVKVGTVFNSNDGIPGIVGSYSPLVSGGDVVDPARTIEPGDVLKRVIELLEIRDLGCRVVRRHNFSGVAHAGTNTKLLVHTGVDRRNVVIFSPKNGDIDTAEYLWSLKKYKNAALVRGKFVGEMVPGTAVGREKRVMLVDGTDIDGHRETVPTGSALTTIREKMVIRGNKALKSQKPIALSRIDISSTPTYLYREDYNIGDKVTVDSSYGPHVSMRVVEYVEIVDENGESSHPTLEILET